MCKAKVPKLRVVISFTAQLLVQWIKIVNLGSVLPLSAPLSWHLSLQLSHQPSSDGSAGEAHSQNQSHYNVGTRKT